MHGNVEQSDCSHSIPPYILVLNIERQGELLCRKPLVLKEGSCPAFNSVDDAVCAAKEALAIGHKDFLPTKEFDRLELYVAWGYANEKGVDYGTIFAVVNEETHEKKIVAEQE